MTANKTYTVNEAIQASKSIEGLQAATLETLTALHSTLSESSDKRANKRADVVAGIMNAHKKAAKAAPAPAVDETPVHGEQYEISFEQGELIPVENSVKPKRKAAPKKKAAPSSIADPAEVEAVEAELLAEEPAPKPKRKTAPKKKAVPASEAPAPAEDEKPEPKKPKSLKRKSEPKPDLDKMTAAQLKEHIKTLEAKTEVFPQEIAGEKSSYSRVEFETITDIQKHLVDNPMRLFMFVDEKLDDKLTQFLVLFANAEIIVLLDRNRMKDTTMTVKQDKLDADTIVFDKMKFNYTFYTRN